MNRRVLVFVVLGLFAVALVVVLGLGFTGGKRPEGSVLQRWQDRLAGLGPAEPLGAPDFARVDGCRFQDGVLAFSAGQACRVTLAPADARARKAGLSSRAGVIAFDFRPAASDEPRPSRVVGCLVPQESGAGGACPDRLKVFEAHELTVYREGGVLTLTCRPGQASCRLAVE